MRKYFREPYGIYVVAVWSVVLGLQNFIRLVYTFQVGQERDVSLTRVYIYQWFTMILGVIFLATAFGLWRRREWARKTFLLAVLLFFSVAIWGVFSSGGMGLTLTGKWELTIQYLLSIILPWIYLNLAFVKDKFQLQRINDE